MLACKHFAGAPETGDHLVGDEKRVVLSRDILDGGEELRRRHDVPGRPLDRLDENSRDLPPGGDFDLLPNEIQT